MSNDAPEPTPATPKILTVPELIYAAEALLVGGCRKRSDVIDFLHTLTASLAPTSPTTAEIGVQVDLTSTRKIFLGPDVNRYYTRTEAAALVAKINRAMEGAS